MPSCRKCCVQFPNRVTINGQRKLISSRKYCLACSPYGGHNTAKLESRVKPGDAVVCSDCRRKFVYDRKIGHSTTRCNSCWSGQRHRRVKLKAIAAKGGSCQVCGYDRYVGSLHFHHIDPRKKGFSITAQANRSWSSVEKELKKCVLLCANCHGETHGGLSNFRPVV